MIKSKFINKYINKHINYILLTIIFMIILIIISFYYSYFYYFNKLESFTDYSLVSKDLKYYRCQDKLLGKITQSIFDDHNIINSNEDWDLYYPCGYNNVEKELKDIQISDNYENSDSNKDSKKNNMKQPKVDTSVYKKLAELAYKKHTMVKSSRVG